jgi:heme/copper-type cytochrome/quinol oxidase subunit 3
MLLSSGTAWWANRAAAAGARPRLLLALGLSLLLGIGFLALQLLDWYDKPFSLATDAYSSLYFTIGGVHMAHAVVGVLIFAAALLWSTLGYLGPVRHVPVTVAAVYWYFVAIVWLALFFVLYVTPYLS